MDGALPSTPTTIGGSSAAGSIVFVSILADHQHWAVRMGYTRCAYGAHELAKEAAVAAPPNDEHLGIPAFLNQDLRRRSDFHSCREMFRAFRAEGRVDGLFHEAFGDRLKLGRGFEVRPRQVCRKIEVGKAQAGDDVLRCGQCGC